MASQNQMPNCGMSILLFIFICLSGHNQYPLELRNNEVYVEISGNSRRLISTRDRTSDLAIQPSDVCQDVIEISFEKKLLICHQRDFQFSKDDGWQLAGEISGRTAKIQCRVNYKRKYFTIDLGYPGSLATQTMSNKTGRGRGNFEFLGTYYRTPVKEERAARIGVGFLKGFDWVIDFRSKKVYARKNNLPIDLIH